MIQRKRRRDRWRQRLKIRMQRVKKGLFILPHLFTFGNAFFGFCSVLLAAQGEVRGAAYLILFGALMDALDGRMARLVGATSEIGVQLDSFADALSFCFAPAFLVYSWQLKQFGVIGFLVSFLFFAAGILRLARFNIIHEQQTLFFLGLPTTIAGCFVATVILNIWERTLYWGAILGLLVLMLILAYLMVSSLHFPTFKQRLIRERKNWHWLLFAAIFAIIAVMRIHSALLVAFIGYFAYAGFMLLQRKTTY